MRYALRVDCFLPRGLTDLLASPFGSGFPLTYFPQVNPFHTLLCLGVCFLGDPNRDNNLSQEIHALFHSSLSLNVA